MNESPQDIIKRDMQFKVYIIESQKPEEVLNQIEEGAALYNALKLASIPVKHYRVINKICLELALESINCDALDSRGKMHVIPIIHFSLHGNENGIELTSTEFIPWDYLRSMLIGINTNHKGLLTISMSCCKGAYAHSMANVIGQKNVPFLALVGPRNNVNWTDSLTAYITFYHLVATKIQSLEDAVQIMNLAAGLEDEFVLFSGKDIARNCLATWLGNKIN